MLNKIMCKLNNFKKDESGASAIEYAVMAALLVVIIVFGVSLLGSGTDDVMVSAGHSTILQRLSFQ